MLDLKPVELPESFKKDDEILIGSDEDFRQKAIELLASIANADGYLMPEEFTHYGDAVINILGQGFVESARPRAAALQEILQPKTDRTKLIDELVKSIVEQKVDDGKVHSIIHSMLKMIESEPQSCTDAVDTIKMLVDKLKIRDNDFSIRINDLYKRLSSPDVDIECDDDSSGFGSSLLSFFTGSSQKSIVDYIGTQGGELNNKAREEAVKLIELATTIKSDALMKDINLFLGQLKPHQFRIVITGEIKHGKSSIFNLLIGDHLSPIDESTATTTSVVELYYSERPKYEGLWISDEQQAKLSAFCDENPDNINACEYVRRIEAITSNPSFSAGGTIDNLDSLPMLKEYSTDRGKFGPAVAKIKIGQPIDALKKGAIIVDTPGVNDPMEIRDKISLDEARMADTIIFVMRADKFGTESERKFLAQLLKKGRASFLNIILTHVDCVTNKDHLHRLVHEEIPKWIRGVSAKSKDSDVLKNMKIFAFDARLETKDRDIEGIAGFKKFEEELVSISASPERFGDYRMWIDERLDDLHELALNEKEEFLNRIDKTLPDENSLNTLSTLASRFESLAKEYHDDILSKLESDNEHIRNDFKELTEDLLKFKQVTELELRNEIEKRTRNLGKDFAENHKWADFDKIKANDIFNSQLKQFENRLNSKMKFWQDEIQRFSRDVSRKLESGSADYIEATKELSLVCGKSGILTSTMGSLDRIAKYIDKGLFAGAIGMGTYALMGGSFSVFAGVSSLIASPYVIGVVAGVGVVYTVTKVFSSQEKVINRFIEEKIGRTVEWLDTRYNQFPEALQKDLENIWNVLVNIAEERVGQIILDALATAREVELKVELVNRIKQDSRRYLETINQKDELS